MPSLRALEEFKTSFQDLGSEPQTLRELNLPKDDLPLPDNEPQANPAYEEIVAVANATGNAEEPGALPADIFGSDAFAPDTFAPDTFAPEAFAPDAFPPDTFPTDTFPTDAPYSEPHDAFPPEDDILGDMSALIGGAGDLSAPDLSPDINEIPGFDETPGFDEMPGFDETPDIDGTPPGLLDGLADEIEAGQDFAPEAETPFNETLLPETPFDETPTDEVPFNLGDEATEGETREGGFDFGDLDFSNMGQGDQDFPEMEPEDQGFPELGPEELSPEELSPEEPSPQEQGQEGEVPFDFGPDAFPDFDSGEILELPGEEGAERSTAVKEAAPALAKASGDEIEEAELIEEAEPFEDGGLDYAGFDDTGLEDTGTAGTDFAIPDLDLGDTGTEAMDFDSEAELEEIPENNYDTFGQDSDALAEGFDSGFDAGGSDDFGSGNDFSGMEDFAIPGLDFDEEPGDAGSAKTTAKARGAFAGKAAGISDEVEEINLSTAELEQFLETLASYPLNLRIACEELIAEQAVAPEQMSRLVKLLVEGAPASETAALAGKILDRSIPVPRDYKKKTGAELEEEQASFAYIFVHNFLPVLRLFLMISIVLMSAGYLTWRYIYTPLRAEKIYKLGIERIDAGEYGRANERFLEAYKIHPKKPWFYTYARAFREARQYTLAEGKYQELLYYTASKNKRNIPEKAAVLEYADLETNYIGDYQTADDIIRRNILDYFPVDRDGLLALGDNSLAWGEYEPARLEDARESYARYMERYGRSDPLLERMLKYFIRTDNLEQVLGLQSHFMASTRRKISSDTLAEMGGYFLDKRFEVVRGVPNEYLDYIGGIREILLRAIQQDPMLPESYYHLARYYNYFENFDDERRTLEVATRVFEAVNEGSPKRIGYHIFALQRFAEIQIENREFFPAEESLLKGINLYQDGLSRRLLKSSPEFGRLYAELGDLEFFVKDGNMQNALDYYRQSEQNGYSPPEIQYRMGAAHYQLREWGPALERIFASYREMAPNRRILYALGNVSYMRGNYFAAQGYYDRLLEILNDDRARFPTIMPTDDEKQLELAERLMVAQNNLGVTLDALTERTGDSRYRSRAQGLYSDSERAWDVLTRNPNTMIRMRPSPDISAPGVNPAYLNVQNSLHPVAGFEPQFFLRIDRDILEPSHWEDLSPPGYRLSEGIHTGR